MLTRANMRIAHTTFSSLLVGLFAAAALSGAGCATAPGEDLDLQHEALDEDEHLLGAGKADALDTTSTYYQLRVDTRKCRWPLCGGYFIQRANRSVTRCADGRYAAECYVTEVDASALGLTPSDRDALRSVEAVSLFRGAIEKRSQGGVDYFVLAASEAWRPADGSVPPSGTFYRVDDNPIRCITTPCPVKYHEAKLNSTLSTDVVGFLGTHADKIVSALGQEKHVLAAGWHRTTSSGKKLVASELYLRVAPSDLRACNTDADCTMTTYSHFISSPSECYCTVCPTTLVNVSVDAELRANWEQLCSGVRLRCPLYPCARPPEVACVNNRCERAF